MRRLAQVLITVSLCAAALVRQAAAQSCTSSWSDRFGGSGIGDGEVYSLALIPQDLPGSTPRGLYVGGRFQTAGGILAGAIARWDGVAWSPLAGGLQQGGLGEVRAMAVFDDDGPGPHPPALYAGGNFESPVGTGSGNIAKWNGTSWSAVGLYPGSKVWALSVFDADGAGPGLPVLVAGGQYTVCCWNGQAWTTIASGIGLVRALASFDFTGTNPEHPSLVAGGNRLSSWDGSAWTTYVGFSSVRALEVFDQDGPGTAPPVLMVADPNHRGVARFVPGVGWNGLAPLNIQPEISALTVWDDDGAGPHIPALYAGGSFYDANGNYGVYKWDETTHWSTVGTGWGVLALVGDPGALTPGSPRLVAGGSFITAGSVEVSNIACWDGQVWSGLDRPAGGLGGVAHAVESFPPFRGASREAAVVGGNFRQAGPVDVANIALWDNGHWSSMGGGITGPNHLFGQVNAIVLGPARV
jgi:hypothetical protein